MIKRLIFPAVVVSALLIPTSIVFWNKPTRWFRFTQVAHAQTQLFLQDAVQPFTVVIEEKGNGLAYPQTRLFRRLTYARNNRGDDYFSSVLMVSDPPASEINVHRRDGVHFKGSSTIGSKSTYQLPPDEALNWQVWKMDPKQYCRVPISGQLSPTVPTYIGTETFKGQKVFRLETRRNGLVESQLVAPDFGCLPLYSSTTFLTKDGGRVDAVTTQEAVEIKIGPPDDSWFEPNPEWKEENPSAWRRKIVRITTPKMSQAELDHEMKRFERLDINYQNHKKDK